MTVLVLDPLTEDAIDGVTRADLQGVVARLNFGVEALLDSQERYDDGTSP